MYGYYVGFKEKKFERKKNTNQKNKKNYKNNKISDKNITSHPPLLKQNTLFLHISNVLAAIPGSVEQPAIVALL